jgi:hypothetical protein
MQTTKRERRGDTRACRQGSTKSRSRQSPRSTHALQATKGRLSRERGSLEWLKHFEHPIHQLLSSFSCSLPELAPCLSQGCRGLIGPVPPPLWIRVLLQAIQLSNRRHTISPDVRLSRFGDMAIWRYGDMATWRHGTLVHPAGDCRGNDRTSGLIGSESPPRQIGVNCEYRQQSNRTEACWIGTGETCEVVAILAPRRPREDR